MSVWKRWAVAVCLVALLLAMLCRSPPPSTSIGTIALNAVEADLRIDQLQDEYLRKRILTALIRSEDAPILDYYRATEAHESRSGEFYADLNKAAVYTLSFKPVVLPAFSDLPTTHMVMALPHGA
jgi:hypothetical protein